MLKHIQHHSHRCYGNQTVDPFIGREYCIKLYIFITGQRILYRYCIPIHIYGQVVYTLPLILILQPGEKRREYGRSYKTPENQHQSYGLQHIVNLQLVQRVKPHSDKSADMP